MKYCNPLSPANFMVNIFLPIFNVVWCFCLVNLRQCVEITFTYICVHSFFLITILSEEKYLCMHMCMLESYLDFTKNNNQHKFNIFQSTAGISNFHLVKWPYLHLLKYNIPTLLYATIMLFFHH